jgi:hypothetical protein
LIVIGWNERRKCGLHLRFERDAPDVKRTDGWHAL